MLGPLLSALWQQIGPTVQQLVQTLGPICTEDPTARLCEHGPSGSEGSEFVVRLVES